MATQAALTAETIAGLRRATGRDHYSSESDDDIQRPTNRGNKLKRKAEYVHEGQLDRPNGLRVYKRRITHAGYQRTILKRNPKRYDEDGDELDDDEVDEVADADAARRNPYSHIRIEELLAPLTSAADLPTHPSLSIPYTSKTLSNMTDQACSMLHRERKALQAVKNLLTKFRGDESYMQCGALNSKIDLRIFDTEPVYKRLMTAKLHIRAVDTTQENRPTGKLLGGVPRRAHDQNNDASVNGHGLSTVDDSTSTLSLPLQGIVQAEPVREENDAISGSAASPSPTGIGHTNEAQLDIITGGVTSEGTVLGHEQPIAEPATIQAGHTEIADFRTAPTLQPAEELAAPLAPTNSPGQAATVIESPGFRALPSPESLKDDVEAGARGSDDGPADDGRTKHNASEDIEMVDHEPRVEQMKNESQPPPHRMTTRAQAQAVSDNSASSHTRSPSPASWVPPVIHPLYQMPDSAHPDRDLGLPAHEAEETRRILIAYVQKQEEVVRGATKLYEGLLRADRMRKTVFKWCRAEGHVGEMSDGEDWYNKEEWGLEEDLRKGHEDEEEDAPAQGKKTRKTRAQ